MSVFSPSPRVKDEEAAFAVSRPSMTPRLRASWFSWIEVMLMIALAGGGMIFLNLGMIHAIREMAAAARAAGTHKEQATFTAWSELDPPTLAVSNNDFPETNRQ